MRLLFMICFFPVIAAAQSPGRPDDSLRKISDTMHFPEPFMFKLSAATNLSHEVLFKRCYDWAGYLKDSLKAIVVQRDSVREKVIANNVPATADITFTILLQVQGNKYSCMLQNYIYHTINGKRVPVEKAATIKDYKETTNVEKVIIMRNHQQVFDSLNKYLEKPD